MAQPLLLQKRITGAPVTAAKFAPSWKAPSEVAPSPKYTIAHADSPRSFLPHAKPTACGTWVAIGTVMDATPYSRGSHHPAGCPRHQASTVSGAIPLRRPI